MAQTPLVSWNGQTLFVLSENGKCVTKCVAYCGWLCRYDLKDTSKAVLQDTDFLCAMAPPGGGRNVVSPRFLRHFVLIGITPFNDDTMTRIFGTLLSRFLQASLLLAKHGVLYCNVLTGGGGRQKRTPLLPYCSKIRWLLDK